MKWPAIACAVPILLMAVFACGGGSTTYQESASSSEPSPTASAADQASGGAGTATAEPATAEATVEPATAEATVEPATAEADAAQGERTAGQYEGYSFSVTDGSEATFTVGEVLADVPLPIDAVLRTTSLSGEVYFDGRPSNVTIDLRSLSSDQNYRDNYVRNRMFGSHPTGSVTIAGLLPLPDGFAGGSEVTTTVEVMVGILGSTLPLTFEVEARDDGAAVFVLGRSTFTWDEFGITKPTARSVVSLEDEVRVEILLALEPVPGS